MAFTVLWRRQSRAAAILSPVLGFATGLGVWLGTAKAFYGEVSVQATGEVLPCVYGTIAAAFSPIPYSIIITLLKPQNYDWADFAKERLALEKLNDDLTNVQSYSSSRNPSALMEAGATPPSAFSPQELKRWGRIAAIWSVATFLGHWVIWPLPMYGSHYIFQKGVCPSEKRSSTFSPLFSLHLPYLPETRKIKTNEIPQFFAAWLIVAIIWLWGTMLISTFYPLLDGGIQQIMQVYRALRQGRSAGGRKNKDDATSTPSSTDSSVNQVGTLAERGKE